jgi:hypothetical protein
MKVRIINCLNNIKPLGHGLLVLIILFSGCKGNVANEQSGALTVNLHNRVEVRQSLTEISFNPVETGGEGDNLKREQTRIDTGIDYLVSSCTAGQTGGKWRTCCDVSITNNTGADLVSTILIGWQAGSGSPEAARTGGNNTGYDGSGTGWRTTDGVTLNPSANGGWALWFKKNKSALIPAGSSSEPRRICLQSPTGYSTSLWYLYSGVPSGRIVNGNAYSGLSGWAMLGDTINDPGYPELGSGNYVLTDPDGFYAFPEITATTFIHNAEANCFNILRITTGLAFIEMPLTPACLETFVPNDDTVDSILVFDHSQNGNVPPLRNITGGATQLLNPHRVAVDTVNDEIIVVNNGTPSSIVVYPRLGDGNIAPLRIIQGANTLLNKAEDVAIDTENGEIFVCNKGSNSILVFSRTANGNVAPLRNISGALTKLNNSFGLAVDYIHDEIFVSNDGTNSVLVFSRSANGNVPPLREIVGPATGISKPRRPAVDPINHELVVSEQSTNSVLIFSRSANGNVSPLRAISGGLTGIANPEGVAVDIINNEILVGNKGGLSLLVFSRTANGNVSPLRQIVGPATLITNPFGPGVSY